MKIQRAEDAANVKVVSLKDVKPGSCIRFAHDTIEEAFKNDLFWMKIDTPELKDRTRLINLADGKPLERDSDHRVVIVSSTLYIDTSA